MEEAQAVIEGPTVIVTARGVFTPTGSLLNSVACPALPFRWDQLVKLGDLIPGIAGGPARMRSGRDGRDPGGNHFRHGFFNPGIPSRDWPGAWSP